MRVHVTKATAQKTAHKLHWFSHAGYLIAATAEGHLYYSTMAALLLFFTVGCALLGEHEAE